MAHPNYLIAGVDIAADRFEVAILGWTRGALRGQSTSIVLFDEIDAYPFPADAAPLTPAALNTAAPRSDARLGRRAARRQSGRARAARRAAAACL
ncbi:hypothetical protein [Sphingomonas sp. UYP23]